MPALSGNVDRLYEAYTDRRVPSWKEPKPGDLCALTISDRSSGMWMVSWHVFEKRTWKRMTIESNDIYMACSLAYEEIIKDRLGV